MTKPTHAKAVLATPLRAETEDTRLLDWYEQWCRKHPERCFDYSATHSVPMELHDGSKVQVGEGYWRMRFGRKEPANRFRTLRDAIKAALAAGGADAES